GAAQSSEDHTEVYTLGEVVVSGEKEGVESVSTTREITYEDIQNQGARTLDHALQLLPGLNVRAGGDGVPRVDIRGFRSRHVLLLLNGIPFNSAYDRNFDAFAISVEKIAKIKVSYGNHSVLYGQGGLAGVINIITKKGKEGVHGSLKGETGEGSRHRGEATLSGGKERVDFFVSGSVLDQDGFPLSSDFDATPVENGHERENSDKKRHNLHANLGFSPSDQVQMGLVVNYQNGEYGKPPITLD
ncbi:MAG: TonB-dependent receptor plug domain-containing protein, partial [Deltaproteobacteria bacterium]|nr:TonB-dependent receptor plug domain-containing protein [Deltaproteobacteria bacterium]